jgi:hypothetical protein
MMKVTENGKTDSHIMSILGLTVGFDSTEFIDGTLYLNYKDNAVACLDGELQDVFINNDYVVENCLVAA